MGIHFIKRLNNLYSKRHEAKVKNKHTVTIYLKKSSSTRKVLEGQYYNGQFSCSF